MSASHIIVEKSLLKSQAFKKLSGSGKYILFQFLMKRKFSEIGKGNWVCTNCQELVFTYKEAEKNHKYSATKFLRAIDELIKHGFLSIPHHGGKTKGNYSLYALDGRWERFGKEDFEGFEREKIYNGRGFIEKQFPAHRNDRQEQHIDTQK